MPQSITAQVASFLLEILQKNSSQKSIEWLLLQKQKVSSSSAPMAFFMAFSQTARYFKKRPLQLSDDEMEHVNALVSGFRPDTWDQLQAARSFLLLNYPAATVSDWVRTLTRLFETADVHEQKSLYAALPVMPFPEAMVSRAQEGLRTNIIAVFDAIALDNPYPGQYLETPAWNQMLLKAIFLDRPLYKIQDADQKMNRALAETLIDFAHERWSAGRTVTPELWHFVGPYLSEKHIDTIMERLLHSGSSLEQKAALLAFHESDLKETAGILRQYPEIKKEIDNGVITWDSIGRDVEKS